ncbi:MAG: ABC transporter permease [Chromatiales bacterium]|nr:ABC transporter permease [Chromatiales bacterium]
MMRPAARTGADCLRGSSSASALLDALRAPGAARDPAARRCCASGLVVEQVYNTGALSLVIIMTCGPVRRHGARPAGLRPAAALRLRGMRSAPAPRSALLKELGPVVTALLFAGRAGTALAARSSA